jgi:hypothetical protein
VPDLHPEDPCVEITAPLVPQNVTRLTNLPNVKVPLIALAPWLSANCTQSFLNAERQDSVSAAVFYQPVNSINMPPPANDPFWGLNDGGAWKSKNDFPVYAIPGKTGAELMYALSLYSGNLTQAPDGDQLVKMFSVQDYARLSGVISLGMVRLKQTLSV